MAQSDLLYERLRLRKIDEDGDQFRTRRESNAHYEKQGARGPKMAAQSASKEAYPGSEVRFDRSGTVEYPT